MDRQVPKRSVAHDESLEHGNCFFSEFLMPRSLKSFEDQSNYVGLGLACKTFSNYWHSTTVGASDDKEVYSYNVAPVMTPEKKLVYEMFRLLGTDVVNANWVKFNKTYASSMEDQICVKLKRDVLERAMHDGPETSADDILKTHICSV